ncbi:hypothetical protein H0H81_009693 [Sphagnurus paluster]|uniref:Uncharacterized protein n=1 Tax=Sphagnurus paluster TaxID=117069 RepID=A0A9P7GPM8_9AGAR|nr:hypothetical protein H0H81_009693 [Sphagnurus paluster]
MPVTFPIADRPVEAYTPKAWDERSCSNDADVLLSNLPTVHLPARILQSSVDGSQQISVKKNGFVLGMVLAYNGHHNLVIRPDDVWIAILSQLNFYINAHAEELRHKFVDHAGKKNLTVVSSSPTVAGFDFADLTVQMAAEALNDLVLTPIPRYFNYVLMAGCGIPFITIEGTQADWQSILMRIDKLPEFGAQPTEWAGMLRVVLKRFVRAFDKGGP